MVGQEKDWAVFVACVGFGGEGAGGVVGEGGGEGVDVVGGYEAAVDLVLDDFGEAAGVGGDDGFAAGHGFEGDVAEAFFEGWGGHEAAVLEEKAFVGVLDEAGEEDAVAEGERLVFEVVEVFAFAGDD